MSHFDTAAGRVQAFLDARAKMRGVCANVIQTLNAGGDDECELRIEDLQALVKAGTSSSPKDAAIARLVREKLTSGNCIPVERCTVRAEEVRAIDGV